MKGTAHSTQTRGILLKSTADNRLQTSQKQRLIPSFLYLMFYAKDHGVLSAEEVTQMLNIPHAKSAQLIITMLQPSFVIKGESDESR